jgi:hypothetical protein
LRGFSNRFNSAHKRPARRNGKKNGKKECYHHQEQQRQPDHHGSSNQYKYRRHRNAQNHRHANAHARLSSLSRSSPSALSRLALSDGRPAVRARKNGWSALRQDIVSSADPTSSCAEDMRPNYASGKGYGNNELNGHHRTSRANGADIYVTRVGRGGVLGTAHPCARCVQWCAWAGIRRVFHWSPATHRFEVVKVADARTSTAYATSADRRLASGLVSCSSFPRLLQMLTLLRRGFDSEQTLM